MVKEPTSSALPFCWRTSPFFPSSVRDMHAPMLFLGLRNLLTQGAQVLDNLKVKGARFAVSHRVLSKPQCFLMVFLRHFSIFAIKWAISVLLNFIGSVTVRWADFCRLSRNGHSGRKRSEIRAPSRASNLLKNGIILSF